MRICVNNLKFHIDHEPTEAELTGAVSKTLKIGMRDISDLSVLKKSVDARHKDDIRYIYSVECDVADAERLLNDSRIKNVTDADRVRYSVPEPASDTGRPVIVGFGPAGMFCAYILVLADFSHPLLKIKFRHSIKPLFENIYLCIYCILFR